jgi:hypothetical protein
MYSRQGKASMKQRDSRVKRAGLEASITLKHYRDKLQYSVLDLEAFLPLRQLGIVADNYQILLLQKEAREMGV